MQLTRAISRALRSLDFLSSLTTDNTSNTEDHECQRGRCRDTAYYYYVCWVIKRVRLTGTTHDNRGSVHRSDVGVSSRGIEATG